MADNYLEKKYEDYKSRKSSGTKAGNGKKATVRHKTRRVFVTGGAGGDWQSDCKGLPVRRTPRGVLRPERGGGKRDGVADRNLFLSSGRKRAGSA